MSEESKLIILEAMSSLPLWFIVSTFFYVMKDLLLMSLIRN